MTAVCRWPDAWRALGPAVCSSATAADRECPVILPGRGEIRTIVSLRAFACLLVVAYHAVDGRWANGSAGVDLFFVVSGLVMGLSSSGLASRADGWRVFAARRLRRLVPLYWTMTTLKLAIGLALPATLAATRPGVWNVVASYFFIPARDGAGAVRPLLGVGWTLQFEVLFYGLFACALAWRRPPLAVVLPVLAPLAALGFLRQADWPAPLVLANGLVLEFCAGLWLAGFSARLVGLPAPLAWVVGAIGLGVLLVLPSCGPWRFAVWGSGASLVVAACLALEQTIGARLPRWLLTLGEASFATYLAHPFLVPWVVRAAHAAAGGFVSAVAVSIAIIASLAVSCLAGLALHRWVDQPMQAWLRLRSAGPAGSPAGPGPSAAEFVQF